MADQEYELKINVDGGDLKSLKSDLSDIEKKGKEVSKSFEDIGSKITSFGSKLSLLITAPLTIFAATAIKSFSGAEASANSLKNTLANLGFNVSKTFEILDAKAKKLSLNSVFDDDDILKASNRILSFKNITSKSFDEVQQLVIDFASKFGIPIEQAALTVGKALSDPILGLRALKSEGILFTDSQENLIKSLVDSGNGLEAQRIIIDRLKESVGGYGKILSDTTEGSLKRFTNAFGNLQEKIGENLSNRFRPFLENLTNAFDYISKIDSKFLDISVTIGIIVAALGPFLIVLGQIIISLQAIVPIISVIGASIITFINAPLTLTVAGIASIVAGFGLAASGLILITELLDFGIKKFKIINEFVSFINSIIFKLLEGLTAIFNTLLFSGEGILRIFDKLGEFAGIDLINEKSFEKIDEARNKIIKLQQDFEGIAADQFKNIFNGEFQNEILNVDFSKLKNKISDLFKIKIELPKNSELDSFGNNDFNKSGSANKLDKLSSGLTVVSRQSINEIQKISDQGRILSDSFSNFIEDVALGVDGLGTAFEKLGKTIVQSLFSNAVRTALNAVFTSLFPQSQQVGARRGFSSGGGVFGSGTGTSDSIPAMLSNGEYVIRESSARKYGLGFLDSLNAGRLDFKKMGGQIINSMSGTQKFASGGVVSRSNQNVFVNIQNNSSSKVSEKVSTSFDARGSVINIMLEDLKVNGQFSQALKGSLRR